MNLREIKNEVKSLPSIQEGVKNFQKHWIKPIRSNTNKNLPFLNNLSDVEKNAVNQKLKMAQKTIDAINDGQMISVLLNSHSRQLIELKLAHFQGNVQKARHLTGSLLSDEFFNIKRTIKEVKSFHDNVKALNSHYEEVNELLQKSLSLEEMLFFMEMPHYKFLSTLLKTSERKKKIARDIGRSFIKLAQHQSLKKVPHK